MIGIFARLWAAIRRKIVETEHQARERHEEPRSPLKTVIPVQNLNRMSRKEGGLDLAFFAATGAFGFGRKKRRPQKTD